MRVSVRPLLIGLGLAFAIYYLVRALWWTRPLVLPALAVASAVLVLIVTVLCLLVESSATVATPDAPLTAGSRGPSVLPLWPSILAVVTAAIVPTAMSIAVGPDARYESYATTYIGAIGAMLTILSVRRRPIAAWIGIVALAAGAIGWMGLDKAFSLGLTGSIAWVLAAQLILRSMDQLARDSVRLVELQHAAIAWQTSHDVRRRERRVRVQFALQVAGPIMERIIESGGALTDDERMIARVAEGSLRDALRGGVLLDEDVRAELDAARRRGASVTVYDEGGLDLLEATELMRIRRALAQALAGSDAQRIIVRTTRHADIAVTVVGRDSDDEDDVSLWREIPRQLPNG